MQKKEFIRQLNELVPRPDPVTTEALYRFDRECAESEYIDMLTALRVVARNFSGETLQGAYELIQHQNAALPSEMFAAAVYLQAGRTPAEVSQLAVKGALMGFFGPERPEEPSRIAVCTVLEEGREQRFYTMDFGRFNPQHALKLAITYGRKAGIFLPFCGMLCCCKGGNKPWQNEGPTGRVTSASGKMADGKDDIPPAGTQRQARLSTKASWARPRRRPRQS